MNRMLFLPQIQVEKWGDGILLFPSMCSVEKFGEENWVWWMSTLCTMQNILDPSMWTSSLLRLLPFSPASCSPEKVMLRIKGVDNAPGPQHQHQDQDQAGQFTPFFCSDFTEYSMNCEGQSTYSVLRCFWRGQEGVVASFTFFHELFLCIWEPLKQTGRSTLSMDGLVLLLCQ